MSLALPLFVSVNKLLSGQAYFQAEAAYAKSLTDLLKENHPWVVKPAVASPDHLLAVTVFALGYGLTQWTHQGQDPRAIIALGEALGAGLAQADARLDAFAPDHMHLVLCAHEAHKAHLHRQQIAPAALSGLRRGVSDILPSATTTQPEPQDAALAVWGVSSPPKSQVPVPDERAALVLDMTLLAEDFPISHEDFDAYSTQEPSQMSEAAEYDLSGFEDTTSVEDSPKGRPAPIFGSGAIDRTSERDLANTEGFENEERPTRSRRHARQAEVLRHQSAPLVSVVLPFPTHRTQRKPLPPLPDENSEWRGSDVNASTFFHSESAADERVPASLQKKPRKPALPRWMVWAPLAFLFPPLGLFEAGRAIERQAINDCSTALVCSALGTMVWAAVVANLGA